MFKKKRQILISHALYKRERKRQREREENWKTLQRKVSGTNVVTITSGETTVSEEFYDYSFPPRQDDDDDIEEEGEETMSDDIADGENNEEHHDVLHPDMVTKVIYIFMCV